MIGQTISHYEILEKLGEGGMGVVYRAHDTKLDRDVALKFLPHDLEAHEQEKARFLQEAQAASALNHPNICAIHSLVEHEGQQFIDMELVEGETLRTTILRSRHDSPLLFDVVVSLAIQIGEALHEAHSHGIVHRDMKPENIMVSSKNQIKVMDFGLAKLKGSLKLTKTSSTVGTLAYMAPEQIQGEAVDARSDIFSFGIVLFEMLTGHLPFRGEHEAAMMYSIVNEEPEPIEKCRPDISPLLANIIQRALEKDRIDRYQSASDMVIELRRIKKHSDHVTVGPVRSSGTSIRDRSTSRGPLSRTLTKTTIASLAVVLVGMGLWYVTTRIQTPTRVLNTNLAFRMLKVPFREVGLPTISADGNWIVFPASDENGTWDLYFMNAAGSDVRRVTNHAKGASVWNVDLSPDGSLLVYDYCSNSPPSNVEWAVYLIPVIGGTPRRVDTGMMARWRPDGERFGYLKGPLYVPSPSGFHELWTAGKDGKDQRVDFVDSIGTKALLMSPFAWSPNAMRIGWIRENAQGFRELFVRTLSTGEEIQLTNDKAMVGDVYWTQQNELIYSSNKSGFMNLWYVPASGGEPTRITQGGFNHGGAKVDHKGRRLIFLQTETLHAMHASEIGGTASETILSDESSIDKFDPSPDGSEIAWSTNDKANNRIFIAKRDGTGRQEIAHADSAVVEIMWSPDGKQLAYCVMDLTGLTKSDPTENIATYVVDAHLPSSPRRLPKGVPLAWIDSGSLLVLRNSGSWIQPSDGSEPTRLWNDSSIVFPVVHGQYVMYSEGEGKDMWIAKRDRSTKPRRVPVVRPEHTSSVFTFADDNTSLILLYDDRSIYRVLLPDGKKEELHASLPDTSDRSVRDFKISRNGKEVFYVQKSTRSHMVIVDSLFIEK